MRRSRCTVSLTTSHWGTCWKAANRPTNLSRGQKNVESPTKRILMARIGAAFMGGFVNFYHNAYNWKGAMMENLAGDSWRGFGDKRYRIVDQSCVEKSKIGKR